MKAKALAFNFHELDGMNEATFLDYIDFMSGCDHRQQSHISTHNANPWQRPPTQ